MDVREGTVPFLFAGEEAETWYRVTGDLRPGTLRPPRRSSSFTEAPARRMTTSSRSPISPTAGP